MTRLEWIDDQTGYRCPRCKLFVAVPLSKPARDCPRCPNDRPLDERLFETPEFIPMSIPDHVASLTKPNCEVCLGSGWVCENHVKQSWGRGPNGCECGAGMPCICTGLAPW